MKYNEAIDMILDGGEAYQKIAPQWVYFFYDTDTGEGSFLAQKNLDGDKDDYRRRYDAELTKEMFLGEDWVVEKDGGVYEEYPIGTRKTLAEKNRRVLIGLDDIQEIYTKVQKRCDLYHADQAASDIIATVLSEWIICQPDAWIFIKDHIQEQDEPAELEDGGEPWEEIKMPIIADEVNEDWLEKKMLCFMRRYGVGVFEPYIKNKEYVYKEVLGTCCNGKCPFCFPQEQPKEDLIKKTIRDMKPIPTAKEASENTVKAIMEEANKVIERTREKVTVAEIMQQVHIIVGCAYVEGMSSSAQDVTYDKKLKADARNKLKQKLEYLVSLQEK